MVKCHLVPNPKFPPCEALGTLFGEVREENTDKSRRQESHCRPATRMISSLDFDDFDEGSKRSDGVGWEA